MKTKGKILIILFVICVIYVVLMLVLNGKNIKQVVMPTYLVVSDKFVWQKENNKWVDSNFNDIKNVKFTIDNKYKGYIDLNMGNMYVKQNNKYKQKNIRAAISNGKIELADYTTSKVTVSSDYYISLVLNNIDKTSLDAFDAIMVNMDFDNNNSNEILYIVSDVTKDNTSCIGTKIFIVKNNEIQMIVDSGIYRYNLVDIMDLNEDGKYEIVLEKNEELEENSSSCFELYELKNGKYKNVKKCELN